MQRIQDLLTDAMLVVPEINLFSPVCRVNLDTVKEHLKMFAVLDSDKDGYISLKDLALHYKLPTSPQLRELFSVFDRVRVQLK